MSYHEDSKHYQIAKKRVAAKKKFYKSLTSYMFVIPFLFFINLQTGNGHWWFIYPALGWGLGLAFEYSKAFGNPFMDDSWEEDEIEKEMSRLEYSSAPKSKKELRDEDWLKPSKSSRLEEEELDLSSWDREAKRQYELLKQQNKNKS